MNSKKDKALKEVFKKLSAMSKEEFMAELEKYKEPESNLPRYRPDWISYFMEGAEWASSRSIDPNTQVGCIITDSRNRLVSSGYNSFPAGVDDSFWPVTKESVEVEPGLHVNKYQIIQHAEANAIAASNGSLVGCTLYVTHHPCNDCAKLIATAGISKVYYRHYREKDESKIAALILKQANIALIQTK